MIMMTMTIIMQITTMMNDGEDSISNVIKYKVSSNIYSFFLYEIKSRYIGEKV